MGCEREPEQSGKSELTELKRFEPLYQREAPGQTSRPLCSPRIDIKIKRKKDKTLKHQKQICFAHIDPS